MERFITQQVRETWLSQRPSPLTGVKAAFITFVLVLGAILHSQNLFSAAEWMPASREAVFHQGEIFRLWTTLFAHGDMGHLLSNLMLFFILGYFVLGYFGSVVFPLAAFAFGGLTNFLVLLTYKPEIQLIGASGVVYWLGGVWLTLYFFLDLKRKIHQRALRALGVALTIFMPTTAFDPAVSYRAHLVGFLLGVLFALGYYLLKKDHFAKAVTYELVIDEAEPLPRES